MTELNLEKREIWHKPYKGTSIELSLHGLERPNDWAPIKKGGVWCYYIYIFEQTTKCFSKVWFPDIVEKFTDSSPLRVSHDYMSSILNDVGWHHGITYYSKEQSVEPLRIIKAGCDYDHLWDAYREYTLEEVHDKAINTADQLIDLLQITPN